MLRRINISFEKVCFLIALLLFSITAYNSTGYNHEDEHYQIIEIAQYLNGDRAIDGLVWEYKEGIRSLVLSSLTASFLNLFSFLGISSPYSKAFILRLMVMFLGLFSIRYFAKVGASFFKHSNERKLLFSLSYFLWFIPFLSVRYSSESISGLLFLLALAIYFDDSKRRKPFVMIGVLFGLSFLVRFQILFAIVPFVLWSLFSGHQNFNYWLRTLLYFVMILLLGVIIDSVLYNELTVSFYRYLLNVLSSKGEGFGVSPWNFYYDKMIFSGSWPLGQFFILAVLLLIIFRPLNPFLIVVLVFVIVHSIVPHKELRFVFPIVFLLPILLTYAYSITFKLIKNESLWKVINMGSLLLFGSINLIGLVVISQKPAGIGRMELTNYMESNYPDERSLIAISRSNPYTPWGKNGMSFYHHPSLKLIYLDSMPQVTSVTQGNNLLVVRKWELDDKALDLLSALDYKEVKQSIPKWIQGVTDYYIDFENRNVVVLFEKE